MFQDDRGIASTMRQYQVTSGLSDNLVDTRNKKTFDMNSLSER